MARNALLLALAIACAAIANGQEPAMPIPMPTAVEGQTPAIADPVAAVVALAPGPAVAPVVEIIPPPPPMEAIVTPEQLMDAKTIIASVFNSSNGGIESCDRTKIIGDYYALATVNCDRAQTDSKSTGAPLGACPPACATGVTHVGATCTAEFNVAYVKHVASTEGPKFDLSTFDPYNVLELCGVTVSREAVASAYGAGQAKYLIAKLQASGATVTGCDLTKLEAAEYIAAKATCDTVYGMNNATVCDPTCTTAIGIVGAQCLGELARAAYFTDPELYNSELKSFQPCGITSEGQEAAPAPGPGAAPVLPVPIPILPSKPSEPEAKAPAPALNGGLQAKHSAAVVAMAAVASALLL